MRPSRRQLLTSGTLAALIPQTLGAAAGVSKLAPNPDLVSVQTESELLDCTRVGSRWTAKDVEVQCLAAPGSTAVSVTSPHSPLLRIHLRWLTTSPEDTLYLADDWERSYGTLGWRPLEPDRILPWYFLGTSAKSTFACGVKTGAASFCFWQIDSEGISLWLDVRNGGQGVRLKDRTLQAATVVSRSYPDRPSFSAAKSFCRLLCDKPRLPAAPVYGGNNWYYAYGNSSADAIRGDSQRIAGLASSSTNRPYMVVDDGWSPNPTAGPWDHGNARFPDMARLAADMKDAGVRPGLWLRPLFTKSEVPAAWRLTSPNAVKQYRAHQTFTLDPSVPGVLNQCQADMRRIVDWGYQLIKHDFSTYDVFGRWGFTMGAELTDPHWSFADTSQTTAEILLHFYRSLREAAGQQLVLGCNTVGHLSAGLFELQRTGDDTSGRDWNRTRKMGVNTLAFRAPQQNAFFAIDADCVGLTNDIPWQLNRQWLQLLAHSGTPLFVSPAPDALGTPQKAAIREAFTIAAQPQAVAEPVDWLNTTSPQLWALNGKRAHFDWFGRSGVSPFTS